MALDATALTTLERVRQQFGEKFSNAHDPLLEDLINEVSADMHDRMGRILTADTYTEYHSGDGRFLLILKQGPLVSLTSVETVEYSNVAGNRVETLTAVDPSYYVEGGLRSENASGAGWLHRIVGCWPKGVRNLKIVYSAGFSTLPKAIVQAATSRVVELFNTRMASGLETTLEGGEGGIPILPVSVSRRQYEEAISMFKFRGTA